MNDRLLKRREDLVLTEADGELLAYDPESHALHILNPASAKVFRRCDGTATLANLVEQSGLGEDAVQLAVDQLHEVRLLQGHVPTRPSNFTSRRRFLRNAGIVASVPAITSVTMPMASAAATPTCIPSGQPCSLSLPRECCSSSCTNFNPPNPPVCA